MATRAIGVNDMIEMADMVITKHSTVGHTAILMQKPLIVFQHDKADTMGYVKAGCALLASNRDELAKAIAELKPRPNVTVVNYGPPAKYETAAYRLTKDDDSRAKILKKLKSMMWK